MSPPNDKTATAKKSANDQQVIHMQGMEFINAQLTTHEDEGYLRRLASHLHYRSGFACNAVAGVIFIELPEGLWWMNRTEAEELLRRFACLDAARTVKRETY